jgi:chemotaxis protein methyltransferase CheR
LKTDLDTFEIEIELLLDGIFRKYKSDFRGYSRASIYRRVNQALIQMKAASVSELQRKVLNNPETFDTLLQFLTVPTSEMFRDPEYFEAIRKKVIVYLKTYPSIKVWVAGCSTGEELYSLAILFYEEGLLDRVHFYATDINPLSLKRAEEGIFPLEQISKFTQNYQKSGGKASFSDYYQAGYGSAVFRRDLKANVVFADHSLATDSVFAEVQVVSCRNVLIYFDRPLQDRVFQLFYDSLGHRGFLGIGSKETLRFSHLANRFEELAPQEKIYRKIGGI